MPASAYGQGMRLRSFLLLVLLTSYLPSVSWADQRDPRLPELFDKLRQAEGLASSAVQQLIWSAWYMVPEGGDQAAFDAAMADLAIGNFDGAKSGLADLIAAYPEFSEAHNQLAIVHFALGEDPEAIEAIYKTLALEPRHFGAWAGLAQIQFRGGDYSAAIEAAKTALAINPQMHSIRALRDAARRELAQESV